MTAPKQIEVFAGNIIDAGMVSSLLESAGIHAYLKDEIMGTMNPWFVSAGGVGAVKVLVSSIDFEKAKLLVEDYRNNIGE
jgi:hypothetical protein